MKSSQNSEDIDSVQLNSIQFDLILFFQEDDRTRKEQKTTRNTADKERVRGTHQY
jgi:hypothetical protein